MAARVKVIDLAKELGVTSKDLIVALEGMGQKGVRAMTPVPTETANELRVKLGRGRELPACREVIDAVLHLAGDGGQLANARREAVYLAR